MFRPETATAMVYYLLEDGARNSYAIQGAFYAAERISLKETTSLISGCHFKEGLLGVYVSELEDLINKTLRCTLWDEHIRTSFDNLFRDELHPTGLNFVNYLSEYDMSILKRIMATNINIPNRKNYSQSFSEWDMLNSVNRNLNYDTIFELGLKLSPEESQKRAAELEYYESLFI